MLEVTEDSNSVVPVAKLPSEYVDVHRSYLVPVTTAQTSDTRETAPDAHAVGNYESICLHNFLGGKSFSPQLLETTFTPSCSPFSCLSNHITFGTVTASVPTEPEGAHEAYKQIGQKTHCKSKIAWASRWSSKCLYHVINQSIYLAT